jgi:hypothetical protein
MAELTIKFPQLTGRSLIAAAIPTVVATVLLVAMLAVHHSNSIVRVSSIVGPVSGFTPYFFPDQIPDQYTVNKDHSLFSGQLLQITLEKVSGSVLTLTEQTLPSGLSARTLLSGGSQIKGAVGPATINAVDGRLVGTLLPSDHATLVLITGPQSASLNDISDLIRALRPSS